MAMMISKFHKLIQSKIVWGCFAALISIAFVSVYTPGAKSRGKEKRARMERELAGRLFGEDVSRSELGHAWNSVRVMAAMYSMINQRFSMDEEQMYDAAWVRLATLKKAEQMKLIATDEQVKETIERTPLFLNRQTGAYDPAAYSMFVHRILPQLRMTPQGFEQIIRENVLVEKVLSIPAQGGLALDAEIKEAFHLYTDLLTVEYAAIPRSLSKAPAVSEKEAMDYYELNKEQFRMPQKRLVHYVQVAVTDYLDEVEATDEMIALTYENNKHRFLKEPAEDAPADAEPEFKPLEEVKEEIGEGIKTALARKIAIDRADELVSELADESMTFEKAAQAMELNIVDTTPSFALSDSVEGIDPTAPFQRAAFTLEDDETHYYSDPIAGRDFVYVLKLEKKLDSFLPSFDVVRKEATEFARITATEKAYVEKCEQVHGEIQASLKAGSSFTDAISKYNMELKTTEPFNIATPLEDEFGQDIKAATARFEKGKLTSLIPTPDEFLVAYISEKVPGDEAVSLPPMRAELAASIGSDKSGRLVAAWREKLLDEAGFEDLNKRTSDET